jgi:aminocarboxymuconate-semialdehyde decarboxylase
MTIDIHAHYIPAELVARVRESNGAYGVTVVDGAATPALAFDYGFKVRPFFPKLVETAAERMAWLDSEHIERQFVATWPDIYGYGLTREKCAAWHRVLNDTLTAWCADHPRFGFLGSVPLPNVDDAVAELTRISGLGALGVMLPANVENTNIGELMLDPLWARAEALDCPIILHPVLVGPAPRAAKFGLAQSTQYTARRGFAVVFRRARPLSEADFRAVSWRRCVSLSRRAVRHHASAHGPRGTGRRRARAADGLCPPLRL